MSTSFRKVVEARQEKLDYGRLLQILDEVSPQPSADEVYSVLNDLSLKTSSVHLTPQKAAKLMADIGRLYGPNKVLDLACGTGQLLFLCDYASQRYGADIDADAIALAQRLQPDMPFNVVDSTRLAEDKKYDMVISALPFGMRARVDGRSLPIERALLEKALALLEDKGVLIALIPPNVLFARVYESFRERVMHGFALDAIINLPGAFLKYTSLESHLIVIRNGKPRKTTYLADYEQAGSQLLTNLQDGTGEFQIPLKRFENRWVRNYYNPKYDVIETRLEGVAVRTIGEIADVTRGIHVRREEKQAKGRYFVLAPRDFRDGQLTVDEGRSNRYIGDLEERHFDRAILNPGDIVVGLIFDPAMYVFKKDDPPAVAGSNVAIIRSNDNEYIGTYLSSNEGRKLFLLQTAQRMTRATISHLSMADLRQIRIPILPVSDLNALSETEIVDAPTDKLVELRDELEHLKMNLGAQPGFKQSTKPESEFDRLREPMIAYSPEPEPRVTIEDVEENLASSLFSFLESRLSAIESQLALINQTTLEILTRVRSVNSQIRSIKESPRTDDEKLVQIYGKLDYLSEDMKSDSRNLREYEAIVRTWLLDWNKLEEDTRVFLPIAEYLYDSVRDIGSEDYSPFVVQYCRSLENEILRKLFEAYHEYLGQNPAKKSAIVAEDLTDRTSNANLFARNIDRDRRDYTLGQMSRVLQLIKPGGNTLQGSDLLQDFREFVVERFGPQLADVDFASSVQDITDNYRNRSAHPYVLDFETAQQCQPLVRQTLCDFLYFYNRST